MLAPRNIITLFRWIFLAATLLLVVAVVGAVPSRSADDLVNEHAAPSAEAESVWTLSPDAEGEVDWLGTLKGYGYTIAGLVAAWFTYDQVDLGDTNDSPGEVTPAAMAAAEEQAATAALREGPTVKQRLQISGTFTGAPMPGCVNGAAFAIAFGPAYGDLTGGGIAAAASQDVCGSLADGLGGGAWSQIGDNEIRVDGSFPAYRGPAKVQGGEIILANSVRLSGGTVLIIPLEAR